MIEVDGFYYFEQDSNQNGLWSEDLASHIAQELESLNRAWKKQIEGDFDLSEWRWAQARKVVRAEKITIGIYQEGDEYKLGFQDEVSTLYHHFCSVNLKPGDQNER